MVLFDLDDTLFDHVGTVREGIEALRRAHPALSAVELDVLHDAYLNAVEDLHLRLLAGEITAEEGRAIRVQALFRLAGTELAHPEAFALGAAYRTAYQTARRAVAGAHALLEALRRHAAIGIVTNNFVDEQVDKLRVLDLERLVDFLVTSEEVGVAKPERPIFEAALARAGCGPAEAVMVGDAWVNDVVGASALGIRAVWFNPRGLPHPDPALALELCAFEPVDHALAVILGRVPDRSR